MPKLIRMNLLKALTDPAATVDITFNKDTKAVTFTNTTGNDIQIDTAGDNDIQFNLTVTGTTAGSASIAGVSFPGTQPSGTFQPSRVFSPDAGTITGQNIQIYGSSVGGNLTLTDNDNATKTSGTQEYDYCVWIRYQPQGQPHQPPPAAEYYSTDPKISNESPPSTDE